VYHFCFAALPAQNTLHMHQARHIDARNIVGTVPQVVSHAVFAHLGRHGFFNYAERTAKAAALVGSV
jgi:hypothetical protein